MGMGVDGKAAKAIRKVFQEFKRQKRIETGTYL
jgi:hypothetical protein